jgi:hypothetical protein
MKKKYWYWIVGIIVLILIFIVVFRGFSGEDDWIKNSRGVYIKHGNPASTPDYVTGQQNIINCAIGLYNNEKTKDVVFNSQCLGKCSDYSVDVVNVPRTSEDNLVENQCSDFRNGVTKHFIELDKNGEVVRVVE